MELALQLCLAYGVFLGAMMTPGPDFMVVLKNALSFSSRAGFFTAIGIACAACVHMLYCVAGIGLLISNSVFLYNLVKFIGAGYMIYLGVCALRSKGKSAEAAVPNHANNLSGGAATLKTDQSAFTNGFVTNLFNPKATLFFLAFFTQVIDPDMPLTIQAGFCVAMFLSAVVWFSTVAVIMGSPKVRRHYFRLSKTIDRVFGTFFVALGVKLLLTPR